MVTATDRVRERDAIETLKAQILELLQGDQEIREAVARLLQADKPKRLFI
jgi:hypothetical protein